MTEFTLNYLAPVKGGRLVAESAVVLFGRRGAVVRVKVGNGDQPAFVSEPPKKPGVWRT